MYVCMQHTPTWRCRFLLQLFISPWHFEACSCLSVPPSKPPFSPSLPFCYISYVSASLPHFCLCVWFPFFFPLSMFRASYQIFHHVTVNKVKSSTHFFLHLFFPQLLLHHRGWFYLLSPACNLAVTPSVFLYYIYKLVWYLEFFWMLISSDSLKVFEVCLHFLLIFFFYWCFWPNCSHRKKHTAWIEY